MKNKTTKRILFGVLALIMIVTSLPLAGVASFAYTSGNWEYTVSGGEATITAYNGGDVSKLTVPATLGGYKVTTVKYDIFFCNKFDTVTFSEGIEDIDGCFMYCEVKTINLPSTFYTDYFGFCGYYACSNFEKININSSNPYFSSSNGVVFNKDKTVLLEYPDGKKDTSYKIPGTVKEISRESFHGAKALKDVTIPSSVKTIGMDAFESTGLEKVVIPKTVTNIGDYAFGYYLIPHSGTYEVPGFVVFGVKGSEAERYAKNNGFIFCEIGEFPDVAKGSWYYDAVKYVSKKGFITGYQNGRFGPSENIRRQDFVSILARISGADLSQYQNVKPKLSDVKQGSYYAAAVNWAVDEGIIAGYQNGKFGVGDPITREQVAAIFYRYMGEPYVSGADSVLAKFRDRSKISPYAKTAVAWAVQNNIISGMSDGRIAAKEGASRAQIAVIIQKMDQKGMF